MRSVNERVHQGRKLAIFEALLEGKKVTETGIKTRDIVKTAKQAASGVTKITAGYFAAQEAKALCKLSFKAADKRIGALGCLISVGTLMVGSNKAMDWINQYVFGLPTELELPRLK
jgi:hypothetical protein